MHQDVVKVDFTESRVQSYKTSLVALVRGKTIQTPVNVESGI